MVSGLVTSPYDQERIASGEAKLMRIASKLLTSSTRPRSPRSARPNPSRGPRVSGMDGSESEGASAVSIESIERSVSVVDILPPVSPAPRGTPRLPGSVCCLPLVSGLFVPAQINPIEIGEQVSRVVFGKLDCLFVLVDDVDRQAERTKFLHQDLE